jgi:hypothetical protein
VKRQLYLSNKDKNPCPTGTTLLGWKQRIKGRDTVNWRDPYPDGTTFTGEDPCPVVTTLLGRKQRIKTATQRGKPQRKVDLPLEKKEKKKIVDPLGEHKLAPLYFVLPRKLS